MRWEAFQIAAIVLCVAGAAARADGPPGAITPGRSGGLVPTPKIGLSREELVRSWDLDHDGKISSSEAEVARARMKRMRLDLEHGAGIDPLTGRPRSESRSSAADDAANEPRYRLPPELPEGVPPATDPSAPGAPPSISRPKTMAELAAPIGATPSPRQSPGVGSSTPSTQPASRSSRASWLPPAPAGSRGLGGPRAGAPAAVSGYGSGVWSDLNAGRPRTSDQPTGKTAVGVGQGPVIGRGHIPSTLPPGRTGALILPGQTVPKLAPLAPAPPPLPRSTPPRISAEDIGGYRP